MTMFRGRLAHNGKTSEQLDAYDHHYRSGFLLCRDFYEALRASGELRVVKKATLVTGRHGGVECSACGRTYPNPGADPESIDVGEFCRCGAQIVKE